ncbi:MAG: VWA domain-containing protein [Candidatus Promineifilaceae bacterium]|nr:VWA domain-containing protein [Candidatus Promineifilaceae bacterium]
MTFLWPRALPLLVLVPILVAAYIWLLRRKRRYAVSYPTLALIQEALPVRWRWRRHLPFVLFLLAVTCLLTAIARPAAVLRVPLSRTTIVLALDISRSMCATDVPPNRLAVAQEAARTFIEEQAEGTQIGMVAFAGFAEIVVPPTNDRNVLLQALANLTTSLGTAIGSATLKSIDAIATINPAVPPSGLNLSLDNQAPPAYQPDIIVLLTDGANSRGPLPLDAAQQAADRGVRVYPIGFGTSDPRELVCTQAQLGSDAFSGFGQGFGGRGFDGGFGGFRRFVVLDEPTLREVADLTGGDYFRAENADQLLEVFRDLPSQIVLQTEELEISVVLVALGALLVLMSLTLSLWWNRLP